MDEFHPFNVRLHGITAAIVADAPSWAVLAPTVLDFIDDGVVVAHNASFDTSVIRQTSDAAGLPWPTMNYLCSLAVARRTLKLPYYRLPFVAHACNVELGNHHSADDDAHATAMVTVALAKMNECGSLDELTTKIKIRLGSMSPLTYRPSSLHNTTSGSALPGVNENADTNHHLYGRVVVFTGALSSMTRQDAWDMSVEVGGIPEKTVTKRTNVLVVGDFNPASLAPGQEVTGKAAKAFQLQDKGQDIELMTEDDFLREL